MESIRWFVCGRFHRIVMNDQPTMADLAPKKHADADQAPAVFWRIMASSESSKMIDKFVEVSDGDINGLVRGMIQSSINGGLGVEMAGYRQYLTVPEDFKVYFADLHSSWQRGGGEKFNRQIRECFPKVNGLQYRRR